MAPLALGVPPILRSLAPRASKWPFSGAGDVVDAGTIAARSHQVPRGRVETYAVTDGQAPLAERAAGRWPRALGWWALLVIPLWLVLCAHWEPVLHDGWSHVQWFRDLAHGLGSFYDFVRECYTQENLRLGQSLTLLSYAPGPYHVVATPLLELAVLALLTAVALGRWPSLARSDDALAAALVTAILFACQPQIGPMLTYRPFTWNYLFGLGMNLWWLMPYHRERIAPLPEHWWRTPAMLVLGFAAGLCNEHTGIAFGAMAGLATWVAWRRGGLRPWMIRRAGRAGRRLRGAAAVGDIREFTRRVFGLASLAVEPAGR